MNPKASIIVPIYNAERYLFECLNSISSQEYYDYEVLLIDDGSTDNSKEIAAAFIKNNCRFKYVYQENCGVSAARNRGLKLALGKYIVFVDSDDICDPYYLSELISVIDKQYDFVAAGYIYSEKKSNTYDERIPYILGEITQSQAINSVINDYAVYSFPWNKIYKKSIIDEFQIQFDESISYGEDLLFVLNYVTRCKSYMIISNCGYNYQSHGGNVTGSFSVKGLKNRLTFLIAIEKGQEVLSGEFQTEKKLLRIKYNEVGLNIYRLMNKSKFSENEKKILKKKLQLNYQKINSTLNFKEKFKYFFCLSFPNTLNFILDIFHK